MADTQIDELRLDITVEDKTSGESSDKKVKNLATAISRLNKVLGAFDNAKFSKTFENMAKGIEPFVKKIDSVSSALESLATIVKKSGLEKAVEQATSGLPAGEKKGVDTGSGGGKEPIQAMGSKSTPFSEAKSDLDEVDDSLRDIDNKWDLLVAKAIEVEKSLDKEKLSAKQILSLVSQRLTIESQLEKLTEAGEKQKIQEATAKQLAEAQKKAESFRDSLTGVTDKVALMKIQLEQVQNALQQGGFTEKQYLTLKKQELKLTEQIAKAENGGGDDDGKKTEKKATAMGKLVKSFGRIAMYRAVRRAIQEITQAFTESIDGIAQYNSEFRDTMGSLQSSIDKAKASVGVAFYQTLIVLEPVITAISNGIVHLSNGLSYLTAKLRGSSTYMRINTEYMKEYTSAVQGALAPFDTFTTLSANQGIDYSKMLEEVETSGSSFGEELGNIKNILIEISGILLAIGGYKIVKWIADGGIKKLTEGLGGIKGKIDDISSDGLIAGASFVFLTSIANLIDVIKNWDSQSLVTKITAITSAALGFAAVVFSILAAIPGIGGAKVLKAIAVGATALATVSGLVSAAKFADGGMMTNASGQFTGAGTMYALAGESGAEVVATGSAGTGVLNVEQFADAMVTALVRYGAARDTSNGTTIVLDGNKVGQLVASNVGFRNEANRRNAGLNWK